VKSAQDFAAIYLYREPVDMRKSIDGLSGLVSAALHLDPFCGSLFCFTNRSRRLIKCVYFDRSGFALWMKRLEREKFRWPKSADTALKLSSRDFEWLLDGIDLSKLKPHQSLKFSKVF
jgi:transposase